MKYRSGYKYQLAEDEVRKTTLAPKESISTRYIRLDTDGTFTVREGYAWDGASGPTRDTPNSMRGSLFHDAGYQLIRLGLLSADHKLAIDQLFYELLLEDGMLEGRAGIWHAAVVRFGGPSIDPAAEHPILTAP